jgi:cell division protein FtsZ
MGTGFGKGENRAVEAAQEAISSPLLDSISIRGAAGVLINITGGLDLAIDEVTTISTIIQEAAGDDAEIIFGAVHDANMKEEVRVTVIATGFDREADERHDNVIRADFRSYRPAVGAETPPTPRAPLSGTRQVLPGGGQFERPERTERPAPTAAPRADDAARTPAPAPARDGGTPVHKFPPPRPAAEPRVPSDLEIPTFIRRQMD